MTINAPAQLSRSRAIMVICEASQFRGGVSFQHAGNLLNAFDRLALEESESISVLLALRWLTYVNGPDKGAWFGFADNLDLYAKELIVHRFSSYVRFRRDY